MASYFSLLPLLLFSSLLLSSTASAVVFRVGGKSGWHPPTGHESETFNQWATRNRFHVGDELYFGYEDGDSVLVVDRQHYAACNTTNPIQRFTDGETTFRFDRHGYYYFISGAVGHCRAAQKLIVRVMVQSEISSPAPSPSPEADKGWPGSPEGFSPSGLPGSSGSTRGVAVRFVLGLAGLVAFVFVM
ncbi:hypothetical protein KSP39_PZI009650 [Platanthera zijinensis]|uniref:Phytocyanin domain-containing protein n=1 Tax=Platanthera zijinensis TaxID=2320716 RepID=A0AAP0BKZ2_9ASPA